MITENLNRNIKNVLPVLLVLGAILGGIISWNTDADEYPYNHHWHEFYWGDRTWEEVKGECAYSLSLIHI